MAEQKLSDYNMQQHAWDVDVFRSRLHEDRKGALDEYVSLRDDKGKSLKRRQLSYVNSSFDKLYDDKLESIVHGAVKGNYGDDHDHHLGNTLHHLPKEIGNKASEGVAREVALHIIDIVAGPTVRDAYSKLKDKDINIWLEGEMRGVARELGREKFGLKDLAKLIYDEKIDLRSALSGSMGKDIEGSILGQVMETYKEKTISGVDRSISEYDHAVNEHFKGDEQWEAALPELNEAMAQIKNKKGEYITIAPTAKRDEAIDSWLNARLGIYKTPQFKKDLKQGHKLIKKE